MDEPQSLGADREFLPLTDSLASRIRWRACDYADLFSAELELMLSCGVLGGASLISGLPELRSGIRLFKCDRPLRGESPRTASKATRSDTSRSPLQRSQEH
jgi:hypothetical protein